MVGRTDQVNGMDGPEGESSAIEASATGTNKELFSLLVRMKLKTVGNYVLDGFAPFVATLALIFAAYNYQTNLELKQNSAKRIEGTNTSLAEIKVELTKLKADMHKFNIRQDEENEHLDVLMLKVIQHVTELQVKMKISPTLDEKLRQPVGPVELDPVASETSIPAPVVAPSVSAPAAAKKAVPRVEAVKKAIEKFNKK